jgi:hypothetical protein
MKARLFLTMAALWIVLSLVLSRIPFGIHFRGNTISPNIAALIFSLITPVLFYGWIVPTALGFWLLWTKK